MMRRTYEIDVDEWAVQIAASQYILCSKIMGYWPDYPAGFRAMVSKRVHRTKALFAGPYQS